MQFYIYNTSATEELGIPMPVYAGKIDSFTSPQRSVHVHHGMIEMLFITKGEGMFKIAGTPYELCKNDLIIYNSGVEHDEMHASNRMNHLFCAGTGILINGMEPNHIVPQSVPPVFHLEQYANAFKELFTILFEESRNGSERSGSICNAVFTALLKMTLNIIDEYKIQQISTMPKYNTLGASVKKYIDNHYTEQISLESVAKYFDISLSYLSHTFKKVVGYPLIQYIIRRRIGEAQTLLILTNKSINEIAVEVGYSNTSHFDVHFTKTVGMSPRKYRRVYRGIEL